MYNARRARLEGIELYEMGQQQLGRYPVHWHLVGEVYGDYARQLSIHDCFSRCVTLHAAVGLQVGWLLVVFGKNSFLAQSRRLIAVNQPTLSCVTYSVKILISLRPTVPFT